MKKGRWISIFDALRKTLSPRKIAGPLFILGLPTDARKVPFLDSTPESLRLLYTADSVPEAEMLTQVLVQAGFHIEYVVPATTGVFGMTGNNAIYINAAEYEKAAAFLQDYLNSPVDEARLQKP